VRILVLHSPYLSGPVSGENRVVADELQLLRDAGHEVSALVPPREAAGPVASSREGLSAIWSRRAAAEVRGEILDRGAQIVHVHNLFPALSPAVLRAAEDAGATTVATLHAHRLLCLPATFMRDGRNCEQCSGRQLWRGVVHRCYRDSALASASLATSLTVHRALGSFDRIRLFLAVSGFVRDKHLAAGLAPDRVSVKHNFTWGTPRRAAPGDYFLFLGRLSAEKGADVLIDAWRRIGSPLVVAGDGPDAERLRAEAPPNVEFRGQVAPEEVGELLTRARALVVPSVSYEGAPRSVLEAYAAGVPVIASSTGALPELVEEGSSGLLVPPGDGLALAAAVRRLEDDSESSRMGEAAWRLWRRFYGPEQGLAGLERAYAQALELRAA
jgi:glycosyltransferase involved in cell wall biosynthesis